MHIFLIPEKRFGCPTIVPILLCMLHCSGTIACFSYFLQNPPPGRLVVSPVERAEWYIVVLYALSEACTSPISLVGCCIAVSHASWLILNLTKGFTQGV